MGYYTYHTLSVYDNVDNACYGGAPYRNEERIKEIAMALASNDYFGHCEDDSWMQYITNSYDPLNAVVSGDSIKWYDHDEDMLKLSRQYPDLYFCLTGEGEERDDNWEALYHNGKMQEIRAELVWPPMYPQYFDN